MAITFVGSYASTHSSTSAQTINFTNLKNAGGSTPTLQQNDIVVTSVFQAANTTNGSTRTAAQLTPTGYTGTTASSITSTDTNLSSLLVSYKQMGATPDTSITIPASSSTGAGLAYSIHVFRGVSKASPLDVTPTTATGINTAQPNPPAITPSTAGAWIYCVGGGAMASGAAAQSSAPTGLDSTTNAWQTALITSTTSDAAIGVGYNSSWSSGAFDCPAYTGFTTTNTGSWAAETLALAPNQAYLFAPTTVSYTLTAESVTFTRVPPNQAYLFAPTTVSYTLTAESVTFTRVLAKASTLTDNFDDNSQDTSKWTVDQFRGGNATTSGTVNETNGRVEITPASGVTGRKYTGYVSTSLYSVVNDGVFARFTAPTGMGSDEAATLGFGPDDLHVFIANYSGGVLQITKTTAGTTTNIGSVTYSATSHAWWKLGYDQASDTINLYTAPSTASDPPATGDWTLQISTPRDATIIPDPTAVLVGFSAGTFSSGASPQLVYFDGFNTASSASAGAALDPIAASYALTRNSVILDTAIKPTAVSYTLSAAAVGLKSGRQFNPTAVSYTLSTQTVGLKSAKQSNPTAASYVITAQSVVLKLAFNPTAVSYTLSGQTTGLKASRQLNPAFVTYTLTAETAATTAVRRLTPSVTTYSLTGESVAFVSGTSGISVATVSYVLTPKSATLDANRKLIAAISTFALTRYSTTLSYGEDASAGAYVLVASAPPLLPRQYMASGVVISDDNSNQFVASGILIEEAAPSAPLYVLTPENVSTTLGYSLIASAGTYSVTGTTTRLAARRNLAATQASYTLTRFAASVRHNYSFAPVAATYVINGSATLGSALDPIAASYSLTGTATSLNVNRAVVSTTVHYTLTSESVIFSDVLSVSAVSYSLTTFAASLNLITSKGINPTSASYVLTTEAAVLQTSRQLAVTATAYAVTAEAVTLAAGEPFSTANYAVTGSSTALTVTRQQSVTTSTYSLTSESTRLAIARDLNASDVVYVVSVFGATHGYGLAPTSVPYTLSRFSSSLIATRDLRPSVRTYALGGFSASLRSARLHSPTTQTYAVTGQSAVLLSGIQLSASYASYTLTPYSIVFKAATKLMLADVCILHTIPISAYPTHKVPATHRRRQVFTM